MADSAIEYQSYAGERIIDNPIVRWSVIVLVFVAVSLFFTAQNVTWRVMTDREVSVAEAFFGELLYWFLWLPFMGLILGTFRRYPIVPGQVARGIWPNLGLSLVFSAVHEVLYRLLLRMLIDGASMTEAFAYLQERAAIIPGSLFTPLYKYWIIIAIYGGLLFYRRFRREQALAEELSIRNARMSADLKEAQLMVLKGQLRPHFLFNTLNTISFLMREDVTRANNVLLRLGELLRISLEEPDATGTDVRSEIDFIRSYLEIEETRFEDRLSVSFDVDPQILNARLPSMILQPLAENAIRHGIARVQSGGRVIVRGAMEDGKVHLSVEDNGPGFPVGGERSDDAGLGLENVRERLTWMFDGNFAQVVDQGPMGGARVTLTIPFVEYSVPAK